VYGEEEIDEDEDEVVEGEEDDDKDAEGEVEDMEGDPEEVEHWEEGDDDVHMTHEKETSGSCLGSRMRDLGRPDSASSFRGLYGEAAEYRFRASIQEIAERQLGRAMTPKDFFTSPEGQKNSIENIVTERKKTFLAGNASCIIDLKAAAREEAEELRINVEDIDRIDLEMDRQALLNIASQHFPHGVPHEPED